MSCMQLLQWSIELVKRFTVCVCDNGMQVREPHQQFPILYADCWSYLSMHFNVSYLKWIKREKNSEQLFLSWKQFNRNDRNKKRWLYNQLNHWTNVSATAHKKTMCLIHGKRINFNYAVVGVHCATHVCSIMWL